MFQDNVPLIYIFIYMLFCTDLKTMSLSMSHHIYDETERNQNTTCGEVNVQNRSKIITLTKLSTIYKNHIINSCLQNTAYRNHVINSCLPNTVLFHGHLIM